MGVGRLGKREFDAGLYVYTGSALNSLPGRVGRHLRKLKKKHWHIDYLIADASVEIVGVAWKNTPVGSNVVLPGGLGERLWRARKASDAGIANAIPIFTVLERLATWRVFSRGPASAIQAQPGFRESICYCLTGFKGL